MPKSCRHPSPAVVVATGRSQWTARLRPRHHQRQSRPARQQAVDGIRDLYPRFKVAVDPQGRGGVGVPEAVLRADNARYP